MEVEQYGLPEALYADLLGIFVKDPNRPPTLAEQSSGKRSPIQVGRAPDALGIGWIGARSAQAKGRIERSNGTLRWPLDPSRRAAGPEVVDTVGLSVRLAVRSRSGGH